MAAPAANIFKGYPASLSGLATASPAFHRLLCVFHFTLSSPWPPPPRAKDIVFRNRVSVVRESLGCAKAEMTRFVHAIGKGRKRLER